MTPWVLIAVVTTGVAPATPPATSAAGELACHKLGRDEGVLMIGAATALGVTSMVAFSAGFELERQLRAREVEGAAAADALTERMVAAFVAWPAALLSLLGIAGGAYLIARAE